jgi:hypothetical protein
VTAEHVDLPVDDLRLVDPGEAFALLRARARALDAWYEGGRRGPRPPGRVREHRPEPVGRVAAAWSWPLYRAVFDPDGRPSALRRNGTF